MIMFPLVSTMTVPIKFKSALYVSSVSKRTAGTVFLTKRNKNFKWGSTANMSHRWTGKGREDYCPWFILRNVTLNINTLKSQCLFNFFFKLTRVTARSLIVWPNAGLFQKQDRCRVVLRSSTLSLATYLLDAAGFWRKYMQVMIEWATRNRRPDLTWEVESDIYLTQFFHFRFLQIIN